VAFFLNVKVGFDQKNKQKPKDRVQLNFQCLFSSIALFLQKQTMQINNEEISKSKALCKSSKHMTT
jgi:hypothetical protein